VTDHDGIVTLAHPERPGAQISLMTHDATAPVIPDVSVQVDDVDAVTRQRSRHARRLSTL